MRRCVQSSSTRCFAAVPVPLGLGLGCRPPFQSHGRAVGRRRLHEWLQASASAAAPTTLPNRITLQAKPLTPELFAPFGQVIEPMDDGVLYGEHDANLCLDRGVPRLYIMRLPRRGMAFTRITYHAEVTQCLGGLAGQPWYLVVARPSGSTDAYPRTEDLVAFKVPPHLFIKLERGTWHAGPLFSNADYQDFCNLELSNTNQVDHNTHDYSVDSLEYIVQD